MIGADESPYLGGELDLFFLASNWKRYVKSEIGSYLNGDVLEVGAGVGGTTAALHDGNARQWVCLEPDSDNAKKLQALTAKRWENRPTHVVVGSLRTLAERPSFDCVLYIDVLEHIRDDRLQISTAARLVRNNGYLVVLAPAHQWLFSEFDKHIGHLRRYNARELNALRPSGWIEIRTAYLDSVGVFLSLGNVLALRQPMPSRRQILLWDRLFVPLSRVIDRWLKGRFGKSILVVWQKKESF